MITQWENECIPLSVLPMGQVMIAQWGKYMHLTVDSLRGPGLIGPIFQGIFPWLITLCQPILSRGGKKWLNPLNGTTQPVDSGEEG